jgi:uncharacterized protein YcbK (DUF882 family)
MTPIQANQWRGIRYFEPSEKWGDPNRMDYNLLAELDRLRHYIGKRIVIHCGYEPRDGAGYHPKGMAVDCHAEGLRLLEFYIAASRFNFGGIGLYPWWHHPGLHLDTRPEAVANGRALWGSIADKVYVPFDANFLATAIEL